MLSRTALWLVTAVLLTCALWLACSKDTSTPSGTSSATTSSGITAYFPLDAGYSTTFTVHYSNGNHETDRFRVGREVPFGNTTAREWHTLTSAGDVNTGYFRATSNALDYYSGVSASPQRILELPLESGHSWAVDVTTGDSYADTYDSLSTGLNGGKDATETDPSDYGGPQFANPASGSTYLTVDGFEDLSMANGDYYSGALKISNRDRAGTASYYWYVAGVGLVKYVIDATEETFPEGRIVGELEKYGFN